MFGDRRGFMPLQLKTLPGIRNGYFYSFQTKELKKNQNIDLRLFDGEFHKYLESLFGLVLIISGLKSLPGIRNEEIFFVVGQKVDELFFFL